MFINAKFIYVLRTHSVLRETWNDLSIYVHFRFREHIHEEVLSPRAHNANGFFFSQDTN